MIRARNEDISLLPYVTKISQIMSIRGLNIRGLKALINPDQENRQRGKGVIIKFKQNYLVGGFGMFTFCGYFMG